VSWGHAREAVPPSRGKNGHLARAHAAAVAPHGSPESPGVFPSYPIRALAPAGSAPPCVAWAGWVLTCCNPPGRSATRRHPGRAGPTTPCPRAGRVGWGWIWIGSRTRATSLLLPRLFLLVFYVFTTRGHFSLLSRLTGVGLRGGVFSYISSSFRGRFQVQKNALRGLLQEPSVGPGPDTT